ncbi:MAG: hypothetical protein A2147_10965 [Chloroflexi bacterium RBG_16_57_8]|nr:MAG: hypothetical protein A2147_10965 [Chloroflexi bacterium RBG_16_57_8]
MARKGNTERLSVTLPRELAEGIRSIVPRGQVSSFVADAVERRLAYHRQRRAFEIGFGAWKDENHPDLKTPEDSIRYVNEIRSGGIGS